jgi:uncharacterized membrane protein YgcG
MAISSGVGPHLAWLTLNGQVFPLEDGSVTRTATRKSGSFSGSFPFLGINAVPGAEATLAGLGDNTASVTVQSFGQQTTLITGEVDMVEFDYTTGNAQVSGRDSSAKLHAVKSAEKFVNQTPQQIITTLAGRVGINVNADSFSLLAGRLVQMDWSKVTDGVAYAHVIHKMTELMGAHWFMDQSGTLNIKIGAGSSSPYVINYSENPLTGGIVSDALSLRIHRNVQAGKPVSVTVNSWNQHQKKGYVGNFTIGGNGTTQNYAYHLPGFTQDHVNQHAKSKANDHARHEITVEAEVVGDPSITIDQPLQLNGTAFSQMLTIDSLTDSFGMKGHTTHISAKSMAAGRTGTSSSASGGSGGFDGGDGTSSGGGTAGSAGDAPVLT